MAYHHIQLFKLQIKKKKLNSLCSNGLFVDLASGGRSADPPSAGAESAAGRADPEEAHPHGHPEEKQQTTHPAAFQLPFVYTSTSYNQLKPNLHLQVCSFFCSSSCRHPTHLEGQAEEGQDQSSRGPGCSGAGFRVGQD